MTETPSPTNYRAYVLNSEDHIINRHDFTAADLAAALAHAAQYVDGHDVEVWLRAHVIGRLKHEP